MDRSGKTKEPGNPESAEAETNQTGKRSKSYQRDPK